MGNDAGLAELDDEQVLRLERAADQTSGIGAAEHHQLLGGRLLSLGHLAFDARLKRRLPRALLASLVMGVVVWAIAQGTAPWLDLGAAAKAGALGLLVAGGLVSYFGLAFATRALERQDLKLLSRRGRAES